MAGKWKTRLLSELLDRIIDHRGKTPVKLGADFSPTGHPVLSARHVKTDRLIRLDDLRYVSSDVYRRWMKEPLHRGDIILTSEAPLGEVFLLNDDTQYVLGQRLFALRANRSMIEPEYLAAWFASPKGQAALQQRATGTTATGIRQSQLLQIMVDVPDRGVQKSLSCFRTAVAQRIALNARLNETVEEMAKTIFQAWFIDFLPVRAKAAARAEGRDPLRAAMFALSGKDETGLDAMPREQYEQLAATAALFPDGFVDSALGKVPGGWGVQPFSATVEILGGGTPKTSVPEFWGGEIPWFSVVDAPADQEIFVLKTEKYITQAGLDGSSARLLPAGTTVISARGTVGKLALTAVPMAINQSCYGLRGRASGAYYNYFSARSVVAALKQRSHGSVFDTITRDTFSGVNVIVPAKQVTDGFDMYVTPLLKRIQAGLEESRTLAALRDTLLPKLLSGEIRVGEAQELVETAA